MQYVVYYDDYPVLNLLIIFGMILTGGQQIYNMFAKPL